MKTSQTDPSAVWRKKAPLAVPRSHPATAVYEGRIYVFGGGGPGFKSLNTVEVYDPRTDSWSPGKEMPTLRSGAAAQTVGEKIYVLGGGFKKPDGKFKFLHTLEVYDPRADSWERGPDMLMPHDYPASVLHNGYIYSIGGHHPDATEGGPQTDPGFSFCERLDLDQGRWEQADPLPTPRFASAAIVHSDRILCLGGVAFTPQGFNEFDCVEAYDPEADRWSLSPLVLPWTAAAHGACFLNGQLYLMGGFSGDAGIGTQAGVYGFSEKTWTRISPLLSPRAAMGVAVHDHMIYLIGGWAADRSVLGSVIAYRPQPGSSETR